LQGSALEEASRPVEEHVALQRELRRLGYLSPAVNIMPGVYGQSTRAAISAWQGANGRPVTGFLSNDDAAVLVRGTPSPQGAPPTGAAPSPPEDRLREISLQENDGGLYLAQVNINGAFTIGFVIDSGASLVMIPEDVVSTLFRTGKLKLSDFTGEGITISLADGSTLPSKTFTLRELSLGDIHLSNVAAAVGTTKSPALLGQSFLSRLKSWSLDNARHVLMLGEAE
jgi:clan AA aspartic protease (TIGR02281 family)